VPTLQNILEGVAIVQSAGDLQVEIGSIRFDSRQVQPGDVFVAVRGVQADGHKFIDIAIKNGAVAVVCEEMPVPDEFIIHHSSFIIAKHTAEALGQMAANYYDHPSKRL